MILRLENASAELNFLAAQEFLDQEIKDLEQKIKDLDKITVQQVNGMAKNIIKWPTSNLAIIGPFKNKKKFLDILSARG